MRSPFGERNGNPLQYSCLGNPMDRGAGWPTVHRVAKSRTQLSTHVPGSLWATVEGTSWQGISVHLGLSHLCEPGQLAHTSLSAFRLPLLEFDALHRVLESAPLLEGKWDGIWVPEDWEELCGPSRLPLGGPTPLRRSADSNPGGQGGRFWPKGTSSSSELRQTCCCGCCPGGFGHRQGAMWTSALLLPLLESSISRASRITDFLLSR